MYIIPDHRNSLPATRRYVRIAHVSRSFEIAFEIAQHGLEEPPCGLPDDRRRRPRGVFERMYERAWPEREGVIGSFKVACFVEGNERWAEAWIGLRFCV